MRRYVLSPLATDDLEVVLRYYWKFSPPFSRKLARSIRDRLTRVGHHPKIGTDVGHLLPNLRRVAVKEVAIYFRDVGGMTLIVRIVHGARDIDAAFFDDPAD